MTTTLQRAAAQVMGAQTYLSLFGDADADGLKSQYRRLARVLHPDLYTSKADKDLAEEAFARLGELRTQAEEALARSDPTQSTVPLVSVSTRRGQHDLIRATGKGDLCDVYYARSDLKHAASGGEALTFAKVARTAADNDLLQAEAAAIKRLRGPDSDPRRHPFIPELIDSFAYGERGKPGRQVNMLLRLEGFYDLEQVRHGFPLGLPTIHMVWIWRRLLLTLGYAHRQGILHGAVLPSHVMIMPEMHGVVLVDWCYASLSPLVGDGLNEYPPIKAIVDSHRQWYPQEVLAKQAPSAATDIMMAARCMVELLAGNPVTGDLSATKVPIPFQAFLKGCLSPRQSARPDDAWQLLQEFDELLQRLGSPFYPRRFRPFTMPTGVAYNS